jgi:outer membrane receptor protein involved in Fe transport
VDSSGEFETYPVDDPRCKGAYGIAENVCGHADGQGTYRYNHNLNRDLVSELQRTNLYAYLNHEFSNGVEAYTEFSWYQADSNTIRHPGDLFSSVTLRVGKANYYNPLGPCGSPNRLPDEIIGPDVPCEGLDLKIDTYRPAEYPRIVDNKGDMFRIVQGFSGSFAAGWDWDSALIYSRAERSDVTHNRVSNTLLQEALSDPTEAAYNPFNGGVDTNIERSLIDVRRDNETSLKLIDFKLSNAGLFNWPAGPAGFLAGMEYREESFEDDRDPRLDGTIRYTDWEGDTFPFVSDVVSSSPTADKRGSRNITSLFSELILSVHHTLDVQLALRYEHFSDIGGTSVPKIAFGWRPTDWFMLRGSWSQAFRAPNLVTVNEQVSASVDNTDDWACIYAADFGGDPGQDTLECSSLVEERTFGNRTLKPEKSDNSSIGLVLQPLQGLMLTLDFWRIEKKDTFGLIGVENHTMLDLLSRLEAGTANCSGFAGNPAVARDEADATSSAIYLAAGICPAGEIESVSDQYANLDTRKVEGFDFGVYYDVSSGIGDWSFTWVGSIYTRYDQKPGGLTRLLIDAQDAGVLPDHYPVAGFNDLLGQNGNQEEKMNARVRWVKNRWAASAAVFYLGDFYQSSLTLADGSRWVLPSMTTWNINTDYSIDIWQSRTRLRFGVNNLTNERAPLADGAFGYYADVHRDLGRSYYIDFMMAW